VASLAGDGGVGAGGGAARPAAGAAARRGGAGGRGGGSGGGADGAALRGAEAQGWSARVAEDVLSELAAVVAALCVERDGASVAACVHTGWQAVARRASVALAVGAPPRYWLAPSKAGLLLPLLAVATAGNADTRAALRAEGVAPALLAAAVREAAEDAPAVGSSLRVSLGGGVLDLRASGLAVGALFAALPVGVAAAHAGALGRDALAAHVPPALWPAIAAWLDADA
jgi:hypothetical protein